MTLDDFIAKYNGKGIDFDGYYGYQCMDLAHQYCVEVVGKDFPAAAGAYQEWNNTWDGYNKITNTPEGIPTKGDVVIWGTGVGVNGHIAVFVSGDAGSFQSFDQNWPLGSLCHLQSHNYTNVLGWFHPQSVPADDTIAVKKSDFENLVTKSTAYDSFVSAGYTSPDQVKAQLGTLQAANGSLSSSLDKAKTDLATYQNVISGQKSEIDQLNQKLSQCTPSNFRELVLLGIRTGLYYLEPKTNS